MKTEIGKLYRNIHIEEGLIIVICTKCTGVELGTFTGTVVLSETKYTKVGEHAKCWSVDGFIEWEQDKIHPIDHVAVVSDDTDPVEQLKKRNPSFMVDIIKHLSDLDPSGTNKYLSFMVESMKEYVADYFNTGKFLKHSICQLIELVDKFELCSSQNLIENKDIYSYASINDIENTIKKILPISYLNKKRETDGEEIEETFPKNNEAVYQRIEKMEKNILKYINEDRVINNTKTAQSFKNFLEWVLTNKMSVFLDADISRDEKKELLYSINHSTNILYD
jgi:hypothetical protein